MHNYIIEAIIYGSPKKAVFASVYDLSSEPQELMNDFMNKGVDIYSIKSIERIEVIPDA